MKKTEGRYKGYYWYWYPDFGVYCCGTTPRRLSADTLDELYRLIDGLALGNKGGDPIEAQ